jgi:hypothetical protein
MTKKCLWCTGDFSPRVARQVYCKRQCKELALQSRSRGGTGVRTQERRLHPEETRKERNRRTALHGLGWTPESFSSAKQEQCNRCAICNETPSKPHGQGTEQLVPDHEHCKPPKPRALLCPGCNAALGLLKDSPERCETAAAYLRKFSGKP